MNILVEFFLLVTLAGLELGLGLELGAGAQDECKVTKCRSHGPAIRFPFRLENSQPKQCAYPGFDLSCNQKKETVLEIEQPFSMKLTIKKIDYRLQMMHISRIEGQLPPNLRSLSELLPFEFRYAHEFVLFNCSSAEGTGDVYFMKPVPYLNSRGHQVYAVDYFRSLYYMDVFPCKMMYSISAVPFKLFDDEFPLELSWSKPYCANCEAESKLCKLNKNNTKDETECFNKTTEPSEKWIIAGGILGGFLIVLIAAGLYYRFSSDKRKKEDQLKIEKFLDDYKALRPTRYSYADIKKITNEFKEKLGQGGYGTVFKGQLTNDILVAVKVLNDSKANGDEFINEVGTIGRIHHVNVVRLVGYCADGFRRALVYEYLPNDSLDKFVSSKSHGHHPLGWEKLHDIALGIAKGIEYLHQGCDQTILHFDIKPQNILLDHNFTPKISDFGLAKLCSKEKSVVSMTAARGTVGYIAPEVFSRNFGNVSYKSDVYSFGMLLLEIVGIKNNVVVGTENSSGGYFPECIYRALNQENEVAIGIDKEEDTKIVRRLAIVGLWCIQWYPVDRPSMKLVIQMLEGDDNLSMPPNPFGSTDPI